MPSPVLMVLPLHPFVRSAPNTDPPDLEAEDRHNALVVKLLQLRLQLLRREGMEPPLVITHFQHPEEDHPIDSASHHTDDVVSLDASGNVVYVYTEGAQL